MILPHKFLLSIFAVLLACGNLSHAALLNATYSSAATIPFTGNGYTPTGNMVAFTLNFSPPTGTEFTVIRNTGLEFIRGTFDNLAQGQQVDLSYGGIVYPFVADYFGGSGNDLVLRTANARCITLNGESKSLNSGILAGKTIVSVAATSHTLMLCSDGTLAALGDNSYGQLGDGTKASSSVPKLVSRSGVLSGKTVVAVAAGWTFSVALCSDGTVVTWGDNFFGALGNGGVSNSDVGASPGSSVPVAVDRSGVLSGKSVVAITAGFNHVLALCSDGTVVGWGRGANGQLGNGSAGLSYVPVAVKTDGVLAGKTVTMIGAGQIHSLALCSDGTLAAWGSNDYRQLGNGQDGGTSYVPLAVERSGVLSGKSVSSIACGSYHNLVLCSDGTPISWGYNFNGELGNNSLISYFPLPVLVDRSGFLSGKTITGLAAGGFRSHAVCSDGTLAYWGGNNRAPIASPVAVLLSGQKFTSVTTAASAFSGGVAFVASPPPPIARTLPSTPVSSTGVMLNGEVAANGSPTAISFEYGKTTTYGTMAAASPAGVAGTDTVHASSTLTGLVPGTLYHYRVVASNAFETVRGADGTFSTPAIVPPVITSPTVAGISDTAATLGGNVTGDGGGTITQRGVVYSVTTVNAVPQIGGKGVIQLTSTGSTGVFTVRASSLTALTGYSFRAYARNSAGTVYTSPVTTFRTLATDLAVRMTASPASVEKDGLVTFSILVNNNGPLDASGVTVTDVLPPTLAFESASASAGWSSSIPAHGSSGPVTFSKADPLANGADAVFTIVAKIRASTATGTMIANSVTASTIGTDSNSGNNTAFTSTVVGTVNPVPIQLEATGVLNRQNGLFELTVNVANTTAYPINGFRLRIDYSAYLAAHPSLLLNNASSPAGSPDVYVDYPYPVALDAVVAMKLAFYTSSRRFPAPFAPVLTVESLAVPQVAEMNGSGVQPVIIAQPGGTILLDFPSVPGRWYRVRYRSGTGDWRDCPVPLRADATRTQWTDCGPPSTDISPAAVASRFYLVNEVLDVP